MVGWKGTDEKAETWGLRWQKREDQNYCEDTKGNKDLKKNLLESGCRGNHLLMYKGSVWTQNNPSS